LIRYSGRTILELPAQSTADAAGVTEAAAPPSLLAPFHGAPPPAPAWFDDAIGQAPTREFVEVRGARVEMLTWGARGKPGLLFLHGNGAHADWWSFIAPFFAADYRVAAMSWTGMGNSDHRAQYDLDIFVEEIMAVAHAAGLFDAGKPVFVGHSFGGLPLTACASRHGREIAAAITVDSPVMSPERRRERRSRRGPLKTPQPNRIYPTWQEAMNRFRFQPVQPCDNLYIADFIARGSLKQVAATANTPAGFTWKFDPFMWKGYHDGAPHIDMSTAQCPVAMIFGEKSIFLTEKVIDYALEVAPPGSPCVMIPEAHHHIMVDQPLAFVSALRGLLGGWPR